MTVTPRQVRLLLVEDNVDDADLLIRHLNRQGFVADARRVDTRQDVEAALDSGTWDAVIADYRLPGFSGLDTLRMVRERGLDIPFILVSGTIGEELAVEAMKSGAHDYVMKASLGRLAPALERELQEAELRRQRSVAEQALCESEARYRTLMEQASDGIFISDPGGRFIEANDTAGAMLGYTREEILGLRPEDLVVPDDLRSEALIDPNLRPGDAALFDRRLRRKDGTILEGELSVKVLGNGLVQSILRDITDRKKAEQRLSESNLRFELVTAATSDAVYDWDVVQDRIWWNENLQKIHGGPADGATESIQWWMIHLHPDDLEPTTRHLDQALASGEALWAADYRLRRMSGDYAWIHERGYILRDATGRALRMIGTLRDMTERREAEEALRNSEERFRAILENASDMVGIVDASAKIIWEGAAVERILGRKVEEVTGTDALANIHPEDLPHVQAVFRAALASGAEFARVEYRVRHKNGSWRHFESIGRNLLDHPAVRGIVINSRDLTERKLVEAQLAQEQRLSSVGRLAATVAHEFNNVLMGIQPFAELLRSQGGGSPAILRASEQIQRSIKRGRRITEEILRFTRPADPALMEIDLRQWLLESHSELAQLLEPHELRLRVPHGIRTSADVGQLTQVISNLVQNAADAMDGTSGVLDITASVPSAHEAFSFGAIERADRFVHIAISDNGSGIPAGAIDHVFEPLYTTKRSGTGLGLAVAHQIVKRHGGEIFAESAPQSGTTFHIFLPRLFTKADGGVEASAPQADNDPGNERLLLVEDDPSVGEGISALLESEGYLVEWVTRGNQAFAAIERFRPNAAILDVGLPDIDGVDLYQQLAAKWPDLPVIFSTGHGDKSRIDAIMTRPNVGFLQKPYESEALFELVRKIMPRRPV